MGLLEQDLMCSKYLALGADVALIGRPIARLSLAGGEVAVKMYYKYVKDDLRRAMISNWM